MRNRMGKSNAPSLAIPDSLIGQKAAQISLRVAHETAHIPPVLDLFPQAVRRACLPRLVVGIGIRPCRRDRFRKPVGAHEQAPGRRCPATLDILDDARRRQRQHTLASALLIRQAPLVERQLSQPNGTRFRRAVTGERRGRRIRSHRPCRRRAIAPSERDTACGSEPQHAPHSVARRLPRGRDSSATGPPPERQKPIDQTPSIAICSGCPNRIVRGAHQAGRRFQPPHAQRLFLLMLMALVDTERFHGTCSPLTYLPRSGMMWSTTQPGGQFR